MKLCIFDLDGTLLDTLPSIAHFGNAALQQNGLPPAPEDAYRYFAGDGIYELIHRMLRYHDSDTEDMFARVYHDYRTAYHADVTYGTRMFAGLPEVLQRLHREGVRLAVVSNKPDEAVQGIVRSLFGEGFFACAVGQLDGMPLKPDPTAVHHVLQTLGVDPSDACYIGDTCTDMQTAKRAQLQAVGVLWGFRDADELARHGADVLCQTPEELYLALCEPVNERSPHAEL